MLEQTERQATALSLMDLYLPREGTWTDQRMRYLREEPEYILSLAMSIKTYGVKAPVKIAEGQMVDGERRTLAAYIVSPYTPVPYEVVDPE